MNLKYKLLVRNINNLSQARYCAGMGVDILGFQLGTNNSESTDDENFFEIKKWLSGVNYGGEFAQIPTVLTLEQYKLDFLIVENNEEPIEIPKGLQCIQVVNVENISKILPEPNTYFLVTAKGGVKIDDFKDQLAHFARNCNLILGFGFSISTIDDVFEMINPFGFCINLKDNTDQGFDLFEELVALLESLEI